MTDQNLPICEKCGKPVPKNNDAYLFDDVSTYGALAKPDLSGPHRHLFPVDGCEGSPSRVQYLPNQPKDTRPGARYYAHQEATTRYNYSVYVHYYGSYP